MSLWIKCWKLVNWQVIRLDEKSKLFYISRGYELTNRNYNDNINGFLISKDSTFTDQAASATFVWNLLYLSVKRIF